MHSKIGCRSYLLIMPRRSPAMLANALAGPEPLTLSQLRTVLGNASPATAFRFLRKVPHLRSYNHNGRFYTHADPARFDRYGLLSLGTARFSRDRSLTATVTRLVGEADAGWTHKELRSLLHVPSHACLRSAASRGKIQRVRSDGVFLYLSADASVAQRQRQARLRPARQSRRPAAGQLDPAMVIEVLLALLRHPVSSAAQLARHLRGHSPPIRLSHITAVFQRFDLEEIVKKRGPGGC